MAKVRLLVGTRKGAFVLTSDERRERWEVDGPHFSGWEVYHVKGSPADPDRLYASQSRGWFGQVIQRSDDGGATWEAGGNDFQYDGARTTHKWYDNSDHPWDFARVWHLEPSLTDPDIVYAGVEDAALFRSDDGGKSWQELPGLRIDFVRGCFSKRRRRQDMAADQPGPEVELHPRPRRIRRTLRPPRRDAPEPSQRAFHAEALGRDAERQRRRVVG